MHNLITVIMLIGAIALALGAFAALASAVSAQLGNLGWNDLKIGIAILMLFGVCLVFIGLIAGAIGGILR